MCVELYFHPPLRLYLFFLLRPNPFLLLCYGAVSRYQRRRLIPPSPSSYGAVSRHHTTLLAAGVGFRFRRRRFYASATLISILSGAARVPTDSAAPEVKKERRQFLILLFRPKKEGKVDRNLNSK